MKDFMKINENDNVIVALKEMKKGEKISLENRYLRRRRCYQIRIPHRYCEGRYQSGTVGSHAQYQNCTWRSAGIQI